MHVTFDPLNAHEAAAVRALLNLPAAAPGLTMSEALALPASVALLSTQAPEAQAQPEEVTLTAEPTPAAVPAAEAKPRGRPRKAAVVEAPAAPPADTTPTLGHLASATPEGAAMVAAAVPASLPPAALPAVPAGPKPLTVEDVRASYRDLFAIVGEEAGKADLRAVLAAAGAATVSDLKAEAYPQVVRSLNAAAILAKSKAPPAAAPAKDLLA